MKASGRKPLSRIIKNLLFPQHGAGGNAMADHVQALSEAVDADAWVILQIPKEGTVRILGGSGLLTPVDQWHGQLAAPHLSRLVPGLTAGKAFSLMGPFENDPFLESERAGSVLLLPTVCRGVCLAAIALRRNANTFRRSEIERFTTVAGVVNLAEQLRRTSESHDEAQRTDHLTGLGLFSDFHKSMVMELSRARRGGGSVTMGIMAVVSSETGHAEDAIWSVARTLKEKLRNFDTLDRYGSSELAFILPELRSAEGVRVVGRVTGEIISSLESQDSVPDIFVGVSCYPEDAATVERLIEMAEAAMNQAVEGAVPGVYRWKE